MIEVPVAALVELIDIAEMAVDALRDARTHPALPDALHGAVDHVRTSVFAPA